MVAQRGDENVEDSRRAVGDAILSTSADAIVAADRDGIIYIWN